MPTGLYTAGGARGCWEGPTGNDCGRVLVARAVGHMRPLVKAQPRWVRMRAKGRGRVEPGMDSLRFRECGRKRVGRKRMQMGAGGWDRARTSGADG
jgi:hypothetical protein